VIAIRTGLVCVSLFLASCVSVSASRSTLTVDQVVVDAKDLLGHSVTVIGFLRFGDDSRNLWTDKRAYVAVSEGDPLPDDLAWDRCLTLYNIDGWRSILLKNDERQVVVRGILQRHVRLPHEITLSECSELGISIESVLRK
jgi:hypothetical protein